MSLIFIFLSILHISNYLFGLVCLHPVDVFSDLYCSGIRFHYSVMLLYCTVMLLYVSKQIS